MPTIEIHPPGDPAPLAAALGRVAGRRVRLGRVHERQRRRPHVGGAGRGRRRRARVRRDPGRRHRPRHRARRSSGEASAPTSWPRSFAARPSRRRCSRGAASRGRRSRPRLPRGRPWRRDVAARDLRAAGCDGRRRAGLRDASHHPTRSSRGSHASSPSGRIDAVTFTSSSTVDNLCDRLGPARPNSLQRPASREHRPGHDRDRPGRGLRVDVTAREYTVPGLIDALVESYG